jgi:ferritin-like metal-binding protein YciE
VTNLPVGTMKLIRYLNEAYGTERRLEVALQAHLGLANRATYSRRLRDHLTETRRHGREVSRRIKQLGGEAETVDIPGPDALGEVAQIAVAGAQRAAALAQGPMQALRGTSDQEKQLKNAKTEYASEAEEIATYTAIITLAELVRDRETAQLAKRIRRDEERMRDYLERMIGQLTKAVATEEIPAAERRTARRRRAAARRPTGSPRTRSTARRSTAKRKTATRSTATRRRSASSSRRSSGRKSTRRS